MSSDGHALPTDQLTLQGILPLGYAAYARRHAVLPHVRRAVWAILACRTALLGGHVQACPDGHVERIWYNACRHRLCPPCAWVQVERWLTKPQARLWVCEQYHVILTMPHELNDLGLANIEGMSQLLLSRVHHTLLARLDDRPYLGAKPGILATLHTWSQTLLLHPHLHGLVTGGGLHETGQWGAVRQGFLLPMRVVMALVRGQLLAAIRQGWQSGQLTPPPGQRRQQVENGLHQLGRTQWTVHIRARYAYGQGGRIDLARYRRGGPIANRRLCADDGQHVVFAYAERAKANGGQARRTTMSLPLEQFVGRWLLHVPPVGAVLVRYWGLYAHHQGAELAWGREPLGPGRMAGPEGVARPHEGTGWAEVPLEGCPVCGQPLGCRALLPRVGVPPPAETGWEQVA